MLHVAWVKYAFTQKKKKLWNANVPSPKVKHNQSTEWVSGSLWILTHAKVFLRTAFWWRTRPRSVFYCTASFHRNCSDLDLCCNIRWFHRRGWEKIAGSRWSREGLLIFFFPQRCGVKDICLSVQEYVIILNTRRPAKVQLLWETQTSHFWASFLMKPQVILLSILIHSEHYKRPNHSKVSYTLMFNRRRDDHLFLNKIIRILNREKQNKK